jgi:hypothetical protein
MVAGIFKTHHLFPVIADKSADNFIECDKQLISLFLVRSVYGHRVYTFLFIRNFQCTQGEPFAYILFVQGMNVVPLATPIVDKPFYLYFVPIGTVPSGTEYGENKN